jgi:hypothetical protein
MMNRVEMLLQVGQAHGHRPRVCLPLSSKFPNEGVEALLDRGGLLTRNEMDLRRGGGWVEMRKGMKWN